MKTAYGACREGQCDREGEERRGAGGIAWRFARALSVLSERKRANF